MVWHEAFRFLFVILIITVTCSNGQMEQHFSSDISKIFEKKINSMPILEFDQTDTKNLNLNIKWKLPNNEKPTKFVLISERKTLNFKTFTFDYSSLPTLIDDEEIIKTSKMRKENLIDRVSLKSQSSFDCAVNCINSTQYTFSLKEKGVFECNLYFYDPHSRACVLYEYDFSTDTNKDSTDDNDSDLDAFKNQAFDYFIDECEMDELIGDIVGYSKYCRRILDYRDNHTIKIIPFTDYRFSLSLRDSNLQWTSFIVKEFQYAPKITIDIKGSLKIGSNVDLECNTELSPSVIDSITWKNNNPFYKNVLKFTPLTVNNMMLTYFCEIRYNYRMIQKMFKFNESSIEISQPSIKMSSSTDVEKLRVTIDWELKTSQSQKYQPEKIILMYSENNQSYRFVNKYLLFDLTKYDNIKLNFKKYELFTSNEDECAMACLQKSFCDHFVFKRSFEPYLSTTKKNCQLATNNYENIMPCSYDSICASLSPYEKHIQNNSFSIVVQPNKTYKFKLQLRDKYSNWTDIQETQSIYLPLKLSVEQMGNTFVNGNLNATFQLTCNTNIMKSVEHQIVWLRNDREILVDDKYATQILSNTSYANSVLIFKSLNNANTIASYNGVYQCKLHIRYPDVGQGGYYLSEVKKVNFDFYVPLKYNTSFSNITLPEMPGILLEISCKVHGNPLPNLKWLIDGVNFNEKTFQHLNDEPFVINITDRNGSLINNILVMKIDHVSKLSKYECILNDNITVIRNYIEIIDKKPILDLKIDDSMLNKLKLTFKLDLKNTPDNLISQTELRPLKFFVLYSENSSFSSAYQTTIAPETLSKTDIKSISTLDRLLIAKLKVTQQGIQSCKMLCFITPFCKSYEYLMFDGSCNLYSNSKVESYYANLLDKFKNSVKNSNFNLIHLLQANIISVLEENSAFNNTVLIDKKLYPECEPKPSAYFLNEELHCSDEVAEFTDTYVLDNLIPSTRYQFRVEVANAFGRSESVLTKEIEIPFPLNKIVERDEMRGNKEYYSLECSTTLLDTRRLRFEWHQNYTLISGNNEDFDQVLHQPLSEHSGDGIFSTELIFKKAQSTKFNGLYTCSLIYKEVFFNVTKNETFVYRLKDGPHFQVYKDKDIEKSIDESWEEVCSADGWPVPKVDWYRNGQLIISSEEKSISHDVPIIVKHHRHTNASTFLIIKNLTRNNSGRYSCVINSKIYAKNITLKFSNKDGKNHDNDTQQDDVSKQEISGKSSSISVVFFPLAAVVIASTLIAFLTFSYFKKKQRSNSNTSLSYNRIEEEIVTGVDNLTLLDESQIND